MSPNEDLLFVGFNQDHGCFACGTKFGFIVYNSYPLKVKQRRVVPGITCGCSKVEMLYRCNFLALTGNENCSHLPSTKVGIWDCETRKFVADLSFSSEVRRVRLTKDMIIIGLDRMIKVFSFTRPPSQIKVLETGLNPNGLISLSPTYQNVKLVYPSRTSGSVCIVDLSKLDESEEPKELAVHQGNVAALAINSDGKQLATASEKGTLIRVWNTETLEKMYELRRGVNDAKTFSINFSMDSSLLCSISSRGTCHIWKLDDSDDRKSKFIEGKRSISQIQIPDFNSKLQSPEAYQCAFTSDLKRLLIISLDGTYHRYRLRISKQQDPLHEHTVNFLNTT